MQVWLGASSSSRGIVDPGTFGGAADAPALTDADRYFGDGSGSATSGAVAPGDALQARLRVYDRGLAGAGSFTVSFYLSDDDQITSADRLLGTVTVDGL